MLHMAPKPSFAPDVRYSSCRVARTCLVRHGRRAWRLSVESTGLNTYPPLPARLWCTVPAGLAASNGASLPNLGRGQWRMTGRRTGRSRMRRTWAGRRGAGQGRGQGPSGERRRLGQRRTARLGAALEPRYAAPVRAPGTPPGVGTSASAA